MTTRDYTQEILEQVHKLDADRQRRALEFVRSLTVYAASGGAG